MRNSKYNRYAASAIASIFVAAAASSAMADCSSDGMPGYARAPGFDCGDQCPDLEAGDKMSKYIALAKLQAPDSSSCIAQNQIAEEDAFNEYFWGNRTWSLTNFRIQGIGKRSEVREEREFRTADGGAVTGRFKVKDWINEPTKIIFMQIHTKSGTGSDGGPLATLSWADEGVLVEDNGQSREGMYLTIRSTPQCTSDVENCSSDIWLYNSSNAYRKWELGIDGDKNVYVKRNGRQLSFDYKSVFGDADYENVDRISLAGTNWEDADDLYLKLGVYVPKGRNDDSGARVAYRWIAFKH